MYLNFQIKAGEIYFLRVPISSPCTNSNNSCKS